MYVNTNDYIYIRYILVVCRLISLADLKDANK